MSWSPVKQWLRGIRAHSLPPMDLSPAGARLALDAALDALSDDVLDRVATLPGTPPSAARFVAARTVFTAPLEWVSVFLGRGMHVDLQLPSAPSDTGRAWASWTRLARDLGLPLAVVARGQGPPRPLTVVMGTDATVQAVRDTAEGQVLGFGARYSAAGIRSPEEVAPVVADLVLHDGRGCMSPGMVLVHPSADLLAVVEAFESELAQAHALWPRGRVTDAEHAALRSRGALAQVLGRAVAGEGWAVHQLPWERRRPASLPRAPLLVAPPDLDQALATLAADRRVSTLGCSRPVAGHEGVRVVALGHQQRPPVERLHDGVDWLRVTLRPSRSGPAAPEVS